jgi:hypothetical protein
MLPIRLGESPQPKCKEMNPPNSFIVIPSGGEVGAFTQLLWETLRNELARSARFADFKVVCRLLKVIRLVREIAIFYNPNRQ